jgi:amino acid permease
MKTLYGISILAGTIVGAGLFSLPYITSIVGLGVMTGYMAIIGGIAILIHYFLAEISLKTPDFLRLPGFAKYHLGKKAQKIAYFSGIIGMLGAILAYLILGGEFLSALLSPYFGGGALHYTTIYFLVSSAFVFFGIKAISKIELWGIIIFIVLLFLTFFRGFEEITLSKLLFMRKGEFDLFLPYGALLFAFWGAALVPEIEETLSLGKERKKLLKIIPLGVIISLFISYFFIVVVLGITGEGTTREALVGLDSYLGNGVASLMLIFGILVIFTSLIAIGLTVKKILWYDLKIPEKTSFAIACVTPFFLYLIGIKDFIAVIGVVGATTIAVDAILILFMYEKIRSKKIRLITYPLIVIFFLGIIYEIIYFLK